MAECFEQNKDGTLNKEGAAKYGPQVKKLMSQPNVKKLSEADATRQILINESSNYYARDKKIVEDNARKLNEMLSKEVKSVQDIGNGVNVFI